MKWKVSKVESLCNLKNGKAYNADDWAETGLPIIRIQNLNDQSKPFNYWAGTLDRQVHVRPGDLLLAWSGTPGTSFGAHIWNGPEGVLNQHIFRIDLTGKEIAKRWFQFCLNQSLNELIHRAHGGVGLKHVTKAAVDNVQIPLPPLAEQKRLAAILDAADALRAKRREALAQLDALLQSTFLTLLGDPVSNPMGWPVVPFGNAGQTRLGKMLDKGKQSGDHLRPYLANTNVKWGRFELNDLRKMDFNPADRIEFALLPGDLLICEGGEVGRCAIWRAELEECYFQKAIHRCRVDTDKVVPEFLQYFLWFMALRGGFKDFVTTSTIAHLTGEKLRKLPVILPPLPLQRRFAAMVESVERQKARQRAHLAELDALFAALQHRAFRGGVVNMGSRGPVSRPVEAQAILVRQPRPLACSSPLGFAKGYRTVGAKDGFGPAARD